MYSSAILPKENVDFYINLNMVSKLQVELIWEST